MKQISTLLLALTSFVCSFAQVGTIYRWVGTAVSTNSNNLGYTGYNVGGNVATFLNKANWRIVTNGVVAAAAPASNPASGATLEIFGKGINNNGSDLNLSAYVFNIQIKSIYNAAATTTAKMDLGFIYMGNGGTLTLASGSKITLGWGLTTVSGTEYWTPGFLMLNGATGGGNAASIVIGATTVANTTASSYLNANGYAATSAASAAASNGLLAPTAANTASLIRNAANSPKANLSSQTTALPSAYFTSFALFYNSAAASATTVAPLPLQLKEFSAQKANNKVVLNWSTIMEINTAYFELEQSNNASTWTKIATVKAAGSSLMPVQYASEDATVYTSKSYYRLKMIDADGKTQYSPVAVVLFAAAKGKVVAYPNPATSYTMISSDIAINENVIVTVMNGSGMIVKQESISKPGNSFRIGLDHLTPGAYILKITTGTSLIEIIKIQKN